VLCLSSSICGVLAASSLTKDGSEYRILSSYPGDQTATQLSFNSQGGYLVTQDNSVDGSGLGIRARRYYADLSGERWNIQVNAQIKGDQQNPAVAVQSTGGAAFAWESSEATGHRVYVRFINGSGIFVTGDIAASDLVTGSQSRPVLAVLPDDSVILVWSELDRDGSMEGIFGQKFSTQGARLGLTFQINQITRLNQRSPAICSLGNGNFAVAWISEEERHSDSVDIYARLFNSNGNGLASEFRLNDNEKICANPALAACNGGFRAAWSSRTLHVGEDGWDIETRTFDLNGGAKGVSEIANNTTHGDQFIPKVASIGPRQMIVWTSFGQDGADEGIFGRVAVFPSGFDGNEFGVNTRTISKQIQPALASANQKYVVAWSSFVGGIASFDLFAQQYSVSADETLAQPPSPFTAALDQTRITVTWAEQASASVSAYLIYLDGGSSATEAQGGVITITRPDWLPSSTHTVELAYRLTDGRGSPRSEAVTVKTWGADLNHDGLPDDWQKDYWGTIWPSPNEDSDGDGATNLEEFYAGTDPRNASSVLRMNLTPREQGLYLEWNTQPGSVYQVQVTSDFKSWQDVGGARFSPSLTDALPVAMPAAGQYYRVIRLR